MLTAFLLLISLFQLPLHASASATATATPSAIEQKRVSSAREETATAADVKAAVAQRENTRNLLCLIDKKAEVFEDNYQPANFNNPFSHDLMVALAQQAAPILVFGTHLLHNGMRWAYEMRGFVTPQAIAAINEAKQLVLKARGSATPEAIAAIAQAIRKADVPEGFDDHQILELVPHRWIFFEYRKDAPEHTHAYLFLPRRLVGNLSAPDALQECGFNAAGFSEQTIDALQKRVVTAAQWSAPCKECLEQSDANFEKGLLKFFEREMRPSAQRFGLALLGHGLHYPPSERGEKEVKEQKQNAIAGLSIPHCMRLLTILSNKGAELVHFCTCYLGGINLQTLRQKLHDFERRVPSANKMVVASSATTDAPTINVPNAYIPNMSDAIFAQLLPQMAEKEYLDSGLFPTFPALRFDLYFKELNALQSSERANRAAARGSIAQAMRGIPLRSIPQRLQAMLKILSGYKLTTGSYELSAVAQVRMPDYDGVFQAVELDDKIKVLTYVDVYKPFLEEELRYGFKVIQEKESEAAKKSLDELFEKVGSKENPNKEDVQRLRRSYLASSKKAEQLETLKTKLFPVILLANKELVMVYPPSVPVPLRIRGTVPHFVQMLGGTTPLFFKEIAAPSNKLVDVLWGFIFQGDYNRRYLVNKVICKDARVDKLLVESRGEVQFGLKPTAFDAWYEKDGEVFKCDLRDVHAGTFKKDTDPASIAAYHKKMEAIRDEVVAKGGVVDPD